MPSKTKTNTRNKQTDGVHLSIHFILSKLKENKFVCTTTKEDQQDFTWEVATPLYMCDSKDCFHGSNMTFRNKFKLYLYATNAAFFILLTWQHFGLEKAMPTI